MLVVVVFVVDVAAASRTSNSTGATAWDSQACRVADVVLEEVDMAVACGATSKSDSSAAA